MFCNFGLVLYFFQAAFLDREETNHLTEKHKTQISWFLCLHNVCKFQNNQTIINILEINKTRKQKKNECPKLYEIILLVCNSYICYCLIIMKLTQII